MYPDYTIIYVIIPLLLAVKLFLILCCHSRHCHKDSFIHLFNKYQFNTYDMSTINLSAARFHITAMNGTCI